MIQFLGTISLIGIVITLVMPIIGFILGIIADKQQRKRRRDNGLDPWK